MVIFLTLGRGKSQKNEGGDGHEYKGMGDDKGGLLW
jgi:hypothetical protein